MYLLLLHLVAY